MKNILILFPFFCAIFFGCNSPSESQKINVDDVKPQKKIIGEKFFQYDEIDHYFNDFDESKLQDLSYNQYKSFDDSLKMRVIIGKTPTSIFDTIFISKIEKFGYKKTPVNKSKFEAIDRIFIEKTSMTNGMYACIYIYRDILVFKRKDSIIGIAKICFECSANEITGTTANIDNFGQNGDYERLKKILLK